MIAKNPLSSSNPSFHAVFMRIPRHSAFPIRVMVLTKKTYTRLKTHCWKIKCLLLFFICVFLSGRSNPARCLMSLKREEIGEKSRMAAGGGEGVRTLLLLLSATFIITINKVLLVSG